MIYNQLNSYNSSIKSLLDKFAVSLKHSKCSYFAPNIPVAKITGAIVSYGNNVKENEILFLIDETVWGGAGDGLFLTENAVYGKNLGENPWSIKYHEIKTIKTETKFTGAVNLIINDSYKVNLVYYKENALELVKFLKATSE